MERSPYGVEKERAARARAAWLRALELTAPLRGEAAQPFPALVELWADRHGDDAALIGERESWSYRVLAERVKAYAYWALGQGIQRGDVVALVATSSPDYLATWLGLTRIGAVVALVNTQLSGEALARALTTVAARHVIAGGAFQDALVSVRPLLNADIRFWGLGEGAHGVVRIDDSLAAPPDGALADLPPPALDHTALYLYTSGTEGFPKATKISHRRILEWSYWFAGMMNAKGGDRLYDCLPLHHAIGGILGVGAMLVSGGAVVLRSRFSAHAFWTDVVQSKSTIFLYIGELCRYLVNQPADPEETRHALRLCCGSGLAAAIWDQFAARFRVPQILEFYAATEGAVSLYNCEGRPGAIGRIPSFLAHLRSIVLVKVDIATGEPQRGADGLCLRAAIDEPGEALGRAVAGAGGAGRFDGYSDARASEAKLLRNVLAPGDLWFRTGDLMRQDKDGFFYFIDRLGDSYRWKGENVATSEVGSVLAACSGVSEATAYGVRIPGTEGRAGMAAVVPGPGFDLTTLHGALETQLPSYARPLFLRLTGAIPRTATLRPQKRRFIEEGFDPAATSDPLYFNDPERQAFVPLDAALYARLVAGEIRL